MIKHTANKTTAVVLCLNGTEVLHRGETVQKMMSIPVGQLNSGAKKLQLWCMPIAAAAAAGISHGTCRNILSDDLNMSHVTQTNMMIA
jgi:hypothetical protein